MTVLLFFDGSAFWRFCFFFDGSRFFDGSVFSFFPKRLQSVVFVFLNRMRENLKVFCCCTTNAGSSPRMGQRMFFSRFIGLVGKNVKNEKSDWVYRFLHIWQSRRVERSIILILSSSVAISSSILSSLRTSTRAIRRYRRWPLLAMIKSLRHTSIELACARINNCARCDSSRKRSISMLKVILKIFRSILLLTSERW